MNRLKIIGYLVWILGIAAVIGLLATRGFDSVLEAVAVAGWGILIVASLQLLPMFFDASAWRFAIPDSTKPALLRFIWIRWIGESVNNLLPVATVAGEFLRAWLLRKTSKMGGSLSAASVMVDMTMGLASQTVFTLIGIILLVDIGGHTDIAKAGLVGMGLLAAGMIGFFYAQQAGLFAFSSKLVIRITQQTQWLSFVGTAEALDRTVRGIYQHPRRILVALMWRLGGWCAGSLEVWLGFYFLGHPITIGEALMVESLVRAVRSAAFMVPGALGIQEGSLILLGGVVGASPEIALALALLKRARELFWGIPGLLMWQFSQLHKAWVKRDRTTEDSVTVQALQD